MFFCAIQHGASINRILTEGVLVHPELGLGSKYTDMTRGVEYPTFARLAIAKRIIKENLSEEMRVLYVAMTRAPREADHHLRFK